MIFSKTPFRVSFFGGGTDFYKYFRNKKSLVIGTAIDKYIYIFLHRFYSNLFDHNIRLFYSKNEFVTKNNQIKHNVIKKIFIKEKLAKDIELHIMSELPSYIGLGSSSSFTVGLLNLINIYKKKKFLPKKKLANDAIYTEQFLLKENVGYQDQILASYGGINAITFEGKNFKVEEIRPKFELKKLINNFLSKKINNLLEKEKIDLNKKNNINIIVSNISSTNDLNIFKSQINQLISVKDLYLASISNNKISYNAVTYGEFSSIVKEINSGIFLNEIEVNNQLDVIKLVYNK